MNPSGYWVDWELSSYHDAIKQYSRVIYDGAYKQQNSLRGV